MAFLFVSTIGFAQVAIGVSVPDDSAMLQMDSTEKGFLMPRMNTTQRTAISSVEAGLQVYDTTTNTIWFHNGTAWNNSNDSADNLGDHTATQNIDLDSSKLVGNGGTNGISIASDGSVKIDAVPDFNSGTDTYIIVNDQNNGTLSKGGFQAFADLLKSDYGVKSN